MSQFKFSNRDSADSPGLRSHTILQQGRPAVDSIPQCVPQLFQLYPCSVVLLNLGLTTFDVKRR